MQRREFLSATASAGAALTLPAFSYAKDPDARLRQQRTFWVDAQGEPSGLHEGPGGHDTTTAPLVEAIRQRKIDVLNATVAEPGNGPDRFRTAIDGIAYFNRLINDNPAVFARVERMSD